MQAFVRAYTRVYTITV